MTIVIPTGRVLLQLSWTVNHIIVNRWIVPVKTFEVLATLFQGGILETIAIAIFIGILTMDHPE